MSLVVLSNTQEEYSVTDALGELRNTDTGIQQPNHFSNHLVNPMKVPRDAEVAVQSVKINRLPVITIDDDNWFHYYLGLALRDNDNAPVYSVKESTSIPIPINPNGGTYSTTEFADELQRALRVAISHPLWWNKTIVVPHQDSTTNQWLGYKLETNLRTTAPGTNYADKMIEADWRTYGKGSVVGDYTFTHPSTDTKLEKTTSTNNTIAGSCIINTTMPANLNDGELIFSLFTGVAEKNKSACIFMTRPEDVGEETPFLNPGATLLGDAYDVGETPAPCDYCVSWGARGSDGKHALILSAMVYEEGVAGPQKMTLKECEWWGAGGSTAESAQITEDDVGTQGSVTGYLGLFKWEVEGEGMRLSGYHYNHGTTSNSYKLLMDSTTTANRTKPETVFPPINQNKWALYFGGAVKDLNHSILFDEYNFDLTLSTDDEKYKFGGTKDTGSSWWSQCRRVINPMKPSLAHASEIDYRDNQKMESGCMVEGQWVDLEASGYASAYSNALCLTQDDSSLTTLGAYVPCVGANMGRVWGFGSQSLMLSGVNGTSKTSTQQGGAGQTNPAPAWHLSGRREPNLQANTLFVKCPSLTAQSYNFCKSMPSQILYHLPRWNKSNESYGEMFYEPGEKTYVALGNTEELNVNQIEVMLVDKNEVVAQDLSGATTIVLHIRSRR
jgi:hypothetical protein